jgi:hypothetical protein
LKTSWFSINHFIRFILVITIFSLLKMNFFISFFLSLCIYGIVYLLTIKIQNIFSLDYKENFVIKKIKNKLQDNPNSFFSKIFFFYSFIFLLIRVFFIWIRESI